MDKCFCYTLVAGHQIKVFAAFGSHLIEGMLWSQNTECNVVWSFLSVFTCHVVKSLRLNWRLGTDRWTLPNLQVSCSDLTLTHCGLVMPYIDIELSQHRLRLWLDAWRHQAITWTNVDLSSVRSYGIHLGALSLEDLKKAINKTRLKIAGLPGANELKIWHQDRSPGIMADRVTITPWYNSNHGNISDLAHIL